MALEPQTQYPGQIDSGDPGYPLGKARNVSAAGAGDGTPWEKNLVNDLFGFQQALLDQAGASPSGSPDEVGASQYLEALRTIIGDDVAALLAVTAPQRRVFSPHEFISAIEFSGNTPAWGFTATSGAPSISSRQPSSETVLTLTGKLPHGAVITRLRAIVNPITTHASPTTDRMRMRLLEEGGYDFATGFSGGSTTHVDVRDNGGNALQVLDSGVVAVDVDNGTSILRVQISSSAAATSDSLLGFEVLFTAPQLASLAAPA